ncbi:hypothetical protein Goari_007648 [Gossypium aridum]|uniref:Uncharacterized protein n=1 Tax=Gossypium aridum TaxID=34290 RepID=A0A7J8XRK4_GOSAI|nr:hypothetical protein [Gossypium aridum]
MRGSTVGIGEGELGFPIRLTQPLKGGSLMRIVVDASGLSLEAVTGPSRMELAEGIYMHHGLRIESGEMKNFQLVL